MIPNRVERLPWRNIDGRTVIVQPTAGQVHELNPVAAFLWERADGKKTVNELVQNLADEFEFAGHSTEELLGDAVDFFTRLKAQGLVTIHGDSH